MLREGKVLLRSLIDRLKAALGAPGGLRPRLEVTPTADPLCRLGTRYGGWCFVDDTDLYSATVLSFGLGEDASFDVEFARRYRAKVIIVDPTPRSVAHFQELYARLGKPPECEYETGGAQPACAYDLRGINTHQLLLHDRAVWTRNERVRFYAPRNAKHVSHSIVNFQNQYATDTEYLEVEAITIDRILEVHSLKTIALAKFDIEGAEIEVIEDMLGKSIYPSQILVEYDEWGMRTPTARARIERTHRLMLARGYRLVHREGQNCSYRLVDRVEGGLLDGSASAT